MPRPTLLVVLAATGLLTVAAFAQAPPKVASDQAGYLGSNACQSCHEPEYASWRLNLHTQMTKPVGEARIAGDFGGAAAARGGGAAPRTLTARGRAYTMEQRDGRYFISVGRSGGRPEPFEVHYTLGARRFQGYLSKLADGRIYVLPIFWHEESKRWVDYEEITPIPDDPSHDFRQIWNVTCVNCHATNLVKNYDVRANTYATTWTEMGIGCEACHGPGKAHVDDPEHLKIFSMKKVPPRQIFDTCAYCHGNKNNVFLGFKAGDRYEDFAMPFLISEPIPANDPQGEFWPDGRPSRFNRPQALTLSGCFQRGQATCTSCHRMHGAENEHSLKIAVDAPGGGHTQASDGLCTQCHGGSGGPGDSSAYGTDHTHHPSASQGSRCIGCHMSNVNWRLITRRLDHTFQPPVPELTARYGTPSACTTCHEDRSPEWAAATMDAWYGNRARRQAIVGVADTMYRAGAGDASALPDVARLAVDRSHGALIRASAAEFAGRLIPKVEGPIAAGVLNAIIGAANDAEPWTRMAAVRTLGQIRNEPRVAPVLAAHLVDDSRVVRVSAAEALLNAGITHIDGAAGAALAAAQDEWAASLRMFGDVAADRTTLGWLHAARGRNDEAVNELQLAITLDGTDARPHLYLGILAARNGRFDEAVQHFKAAKRLAPAHPNLDRLIEEAQKRR